MQTVNRSKPVCLPASGRPYLYDEYDRVNTGTDETIQTDDSKFYFALGRALYEQGYRNFDAITLNAYLKDKDETRKEFDKRGGYREVEALKSLINRIMSMLF